MTNKTDNDFNITEEDGKFIDSLAQVIYDYNVYKGWHTKPREVGTDLMLIVSEAAEAMEGARKGLMDDKLPHRKMIEVELADIIIRTLDTAKKYDLNVGAALVEKFQFNKVREDHKLENREKDGGKKF